MTTHAQVAFVGVSKSFGSVEVLHDVSFEVAPGEVHALIGENGAGKSTLMKILGGYQPPSSGEVLLNGRPVKFRDSRDAGAHGVVLIHQEFNLAEDLSIAQNMFLGRERGGLLLDEAAMNAGAAAALARLNVTLDPRTRVRELSVPQKQLVEIAGALSRDAKVLIMDEPTASLTLGETETLFALMRRLVAEGVTMLYISHKLNEVKAVARRVTVLRDGRYVTTEPVAKLSEHDMASLMVGRELEDMFPPKREPRAQELLRVENLNVPGWANGVSFTLCAGEVLGFAGLVGAGRTEAFEGLLGLRKAAIGRALLRGEPIRLGSPQAAARAGVVYLSEDRKGKGLLTQMPLTPNLTLMTLQNYAHPLLDVRAEERAMVRAQREYGIRAGSLGVPAGALSGGNQQKLALARILEPNPDVIILDEPTRGVDVGAKRDIYILIHRLAQAGKGVIVISSEMQELLGVSHRVVAMHAGRIVGSLSGDELTEREVIQYITGLNSRPGPAALPPVTPQPAPEPR